MNSILIAAAVLATTGAQPVITDSAAGAAAAKTEAAPAAPKRAQQVCIVDTITGSRMPVKQCKTRAEWARDGVDIDQKN